MSTGIFRTAPRLLGQVPAWSLAVVAMLSIQTGSALSISLFPAVGPAGTAWLRLSLGAVILLLLVRPKLSLIRRDNVLGLLGLGAATGVMTSAFLSALERIPLGTTVAIEFLGPLTVAALSGKNVRAAIWPVVALVGVVLLTRPWTGSVDLVGVAFAALAAICWGLYIVFTQQVGDRFRGIQGLALATPVAAVTASFVGVPQAWGNLSWEVLAWGVVLAVLTPVFPFALEMLALKRMNTRAFGTLMAVEPGVATGIGLLLLFQVPSVLDAMGILLVVLAGIATQRDASRPPLLDLPAVAEPR
ncbi:MAG: Threonine/homoserine exporter RhtA [Cellulomonadaceae bacterium TMED98]|nr:MAG: Threonine/homoserine exporter RhtA [Cellulomonadaceae bacterium TMED98]